MDEEANERDLELVAPDADSDGVRGGGVDGDDVRVLEWVDGLPIGDDLTPLSQSLVSPELASAFSITPMDVKTMLDVHRATQYTISNLRRHNNPSCPLTATLKPFSSGTAADEDSILFEADDSKEPSTSRKASRSASVATETVEGDSSSPLRVENSDDENSGRMLKRPRLVWTPQLHKRFVDVVAHLGMKNAVPKTIMQLMNVDGLTRENVASHLQKYRLYLKRSMQGLSNEDPSSSDHLFAWTLVPPSLNEQQMVQPMPAPMPYTVPTMIPTSAYSMPHHAQGVVPVNSHHGGPLYNGFGSHRPYAPNDWSGGSKFASIVSYPYVSPNDK